MFFSRISTSDFGRPRNPVKSLVALDLADHPVRLVAVDGGEAEDDVLEDLDEDAAQTEHDQRSHGIAVHPEDDLIPRHGHLLDENPLEDGRGIVVLRVRHDPGEGLLRLLLRLDPDDDAARIRFVEDLRGDDLHDDGQTDLLRDPRRLRLILCELRRQRVETVALQEFQAVQLAQAGPPGGEAAPDHLLRLASGRA